MRGNPYRNGEARHMARSIPAYAGEPTAATPTATPFGVYPRVCGGTGDVARLSEMRQGLSPRMRGNRLAVDPSTASLRSIPAYAGEPTTLGPAPKPKRVYPRVCGGTVRNAGADASRKGLSPRMRGNRSFPLGMAGGHRSIPAYAGEPGDGQPAVADRRVYPRVCGGTPAGAGRRPAKAGSIPAYAGEPMRAWRRQTISTVYPRVCGGTSANPKIAFIPQGLSPRMRGNQRWLYSSSASDRSIPAYAGEPTSAVLLASSVEVYPRVCGGTHQGSRHHFPYRGLSPRMRGNQPRDPHFGQPERSIPAYAGEPPAISDSESGIWVYPRVCGGTHPNSR